MSDYKFRFQKAVEFLKEEKGYIYDDIVEKLEEFRNKMPNSKKTPSTSKSQISRYYNGDAEVTLRIITFVEKYLETLKVNWNAAHKKYEVEEGATIKEEFIPKKTFKNVKGVYEMYHLSHFSDTILKNIIRIDQDGEVTIDGYSACTHKGNAEIFKGSFLSIHIHTLIDEEGEKEPFYYQIFANLNGNIQNGEIFHFFGISTTVSMTDEAMANKRVFVRLSNDEKEQNSEWFHELLYVKNEEDMKKLNDSKAGKIADYLLESSSLIIKEKTNQKLQ